MNLLTRINPLKSKALRINSILPNASNVLLTTYFGSEFLRVLMVTPSYHPITGGYESIVRSISTKLNEIGVHTDVMTFNMNQKWNPIWKGKTEKIDGINVMKIPALNWFPMVHPERITLKVNLIPGRFANQLKRYDVIHFHGDDDISFPLFSYFVKKPKIYHLHGISDFYERYFLSRWILKNVADLYIPISKLLEKELLKLGIPEHKIRRLPNGIDTRVFHPSGKKEDKLVLYVGRVTYSKGLHILLKSLRYLKKPIHLVIIGPSYYDLTYFRQISTLIETENNKGKHIVTYLGPQDRTNVAKWCQKASILVLPSFWELFPVVNLEALACETPVVATSVGSISEVVKDGENGILVPPNDAIKLAQAIQYLLDNEEIRIKFGREGRKWVVKHLSLEVVVEKLCRIYKEIIDYL